MKTVDKFWSYIEKTDDCWLWKRRTNKYGHCVLFAEKQRIIVSRYCYELHNGPITKGMNVFRTCKNLRCLNPRHLFLDKKNAHQPSIYNTKPEEERFWSKVHKLQEENGCWVWLRSERKGYGVFNRKHGSDLATHYSWELHNGHPVPGNLFVCHTCDHRWCVNPAHLFLGTTQDNTKDKVNKNRQAKGVNHGLSKLTQEQVDAIRSDTTSTHTALGIKYNISRTSIAKIRKNLAYT